VSSRIANLRRRDDESTAGVLAARPPGRELVGGQPGPALRAAAERVLAGWNNERGDAINVGEAADTMQWVVRAVESAWAGDPIAGEMPKATVLARRLVQLIRAELLAAPEDAVIAPAPTVLLAILRAIEQVRVALEPDWSEYFASRLSGPDGLELVVDVAHDMRSPLTSVLFLAETLQRGQSGEINEVQRRQLGLIYSAALGLSSMAADVIELARGSDQLVEKEPAPFSVTAIMESVRDIVRPIAEEKGLTISLIPPASDNRTGRSQALSRVLLNLTTNALKFTDEGYVELAARLSGLALMEFSVKDTGHGISAEAMSNLFQPFRRTQARTGRSGYYFSGTGLGLAMCRKLVEALGSELKFETSPEHGTRFFFELDLPPASNL
jgi:signal transduction histidine kinase